MDQFSTIILLQVALMSRKMTWDFVVKRCLNLSALIFVGLSDLWPEAVTTKALQILTSLHYDVAIILSDVRRKIAPALL